MPELIKDSVLWAPVIALGVFALVVLVSAIVQLVFRIFLTRRERVSPEALDTQILEAIRVPVVLFLLILGLFLGFLVFTELTSSRFDYLDEWNVWVRKAWVVVIIGEVSHLASRLTQVLMGWYISRITARTSMDVDSKLLPPVKRILPLIIYTVGTLVALDSLDLSISPLLAGFGIGGLAVALAVQPTLSNFFAGTYLVTEGVLKPGDFIELDGGQSGFVVSVDWRSTKIRSRFNNLVIIPNSKMIDTIVTNYYSPTPAMNVIVNCGVSYDSDLAQVEKIVLEVAQGVIDNSPHAIKDVEPFFSFSDFGDSNIDFFIFLQANDRMGSFILKSEVIRHIHARFKQENIEINYPVRKLVSAETDSAAHAIPS